MDVREKLVELLAGCPCESDCDGMVGSCPHRKNGNCNEIFKLSYCAVSKLAQHLITHGVTVQECGHWEDEHGDYVCSCCHTVFTDDLVWLVRGESNEPNYCPNCGAKMMPQPPKGE